MTTETFTCPQCKEEKPYQKGYLICSDCQASFAGRNHQPKGKYDFYSFRLCTIEDLNAVDVVWNYYHNEDAVMPKILEDFALMARDLKHQVELKSISFGKAKRKLVRYWESLMDCTIDDRERDCMEFVKEIFQEIPQTPVVEQLTLF
jgi:hypothetical protein